MIKLYILHWRVKLRIINDILEFTDDYKIIAILSSTAFEKSI